MIEIKAPQFPESIADGEVAKGIVGYNPIIAGQLTKEEIKLSSEDSARPLNLKVNDVEIENSEKKIKKYVPLSKRQDRPSAIAWLVKFHPELTDAQISKLVGTTKPTILTIRDRSHWNISNIQPVDPVALGLCKQLELDAAVRKAAEKLEKDTDITSEEDKIKLMSTEQSLKTDEEPKIPSSISGLEKFSLSKDEHDGSSVDADSLFNLPPTSD